MAVWTANNSKWDLSEAAQAWWEKFKETPGEENTKIWRSVFDWTKMLGRG